MIGTTDKHWPDSAAGPKRGPEKRRKTLFLCTRNSCRSQRDEIKSSIEELPRVLEAYRL
jgi:hypothetical protein